MGLIVIWGCACLGICVWAGLLIYFDVRYRRLPDWLTIPGVIVAAPWMSLAGLLWSGIYACAAVVGAQRGHAGMGGGDVKLAFPLGIAVAQVAGEWAVLAAITLANLATLIVVWWPMLRGCGRTREALPHGPAMLVAAGIVCVAGAL